MEEARKGRGGSVQDRCGLQREPELHGGRGGRQEGKGEKDLFRIGVIGNGSLNSTEGGRTGYGRGTDGVRTGCERATDGVQTGYGRGTNGVGTA